MNAPCPQALHVMSFLREDKSFVLFPGLRCLDVSLQHICDYNLPLIMLAISPKLSTLALSNIGTKHQDWVTTFLSSLYPESLSSLSLEGHLKFLLHLPVYPNLATLNIDIEDMGNASLILAAVSSLTIVKDLSITFDSLNRKDNMSGLRTTKLLSLGKIKFWEGLCGLGKRDKHQV